MQRNKKNEAVEVLTSFSSRLCMPICASWSDSANLSSAILISSSVTWEPPGIRERKQGCVSVLVLAVPTTMPLVWLFMWLWLTSCVYLSNCSYLIVLTLLSHPKYSYPTEFLCDSVKLIFSVFWDYFIKFLFIIMYISNKYNISFLSMHSTDMLLCVGKAAFSYIFLITVNPW